MKQNPASEMKDAQLSPQVLSSKTAYLFWATLYCVLHLSLFVYFFSGELPSDSLSFYCVVLALTLGPFFYLSDLYLRIIWLPYRREAKRRGGIPNSSAKHHSYHFEVIFIRGIGVAGLSLALAVSVHLFGSEQYSDKFAWPFVKFSSVVGLPVFCFGFYHNFFIWKGLRND